MALDLNAKEIERAKFAFSIYDFEGNEMLDGLDLGNCLRALGLFPTQKFCEKLGGQKRKGLKKFKIEEFLTIYSQAVKDKDVGNIADYTECLKLYDKNEDGLMVYEELKHILGCMGEKLELDEVVDIMADCATLPDEDGFTPYKKFLDKLIAGPFKDEDEEKPAE